MSADYAIVATTVADQAQAERLVATALESRLAACAQLFPVRSHYVWKDELRDEAEILIQMKIRVADYEALAALIRSLHAYETPEIVRIDIAAGDRDYFDWIDSVTRRD